VRPHRPPDKHPERKFDPNPRIAFHQLRSGSGVAKDHDLFRAELQTRLLCRGGMIGLREYGQAAARYRLGQPFDRLGVSGPASPYEHHPIPDFRSS
jgi:hypothetical protein